MSLSSALATISARILTSCDWSPTNLSTVSRLLDLYGEITTVDDEELNPSAALDVLRDKLHEVAGHLRLLKVERHQDVVDKLSSLCVLDDFKHCIAEEVLATAISLGVTVDAWDALTLETSMFHAKDFSKRNHKSVGHIEPARDGLRVIGGGKTE